MRTKDLSAGTRAGRRTSPASTPLSKARAERAAWRQKRRRGGLEFFDPDVPELDDPYAVVLQPEGAAGMPRRFHIDGLLAVEDHHEMIAVGGDLIGVPLPHRLGR